MQRVMVSPGRASGNDALSVAVIHAGEETRIRLRGELDLAVIDEFRRALAGAEHDGRLVVVDMRGLRFMDVVGLRLLLSAGNRLGDRLTLRGCSGQVQRLFELMGAAERFRLVD